MKSRRRERDTVFDWRQFRARAERLRSLRAQDDHLDAETIRAVLEKRARALASVPPAEVHAADVFDVVTFALSNEGYAIEARYVQEVTRLTELTPLPGAPPFFVGVINLHGEILGVIDLRAMLGIATQGLKDLSRVIVLGTDRAEFGVLADSVAGVRTLRVDEIHEAPASVSGIGREYLRGLTAEAVAVLDGAVLLKDTRLFIESDGNEESS